MTWTVSKDGYAEYTGPGGDLMRILPPKEGAEFPHWKLQDQWRGSWENCRNADSEAEARSLIEQITQHRFDVKAFDRPNIHIPRGKRIHTPWGNSQGGTKYADGIESHHTAGHGGFKLSAAMNRKVHEAWRSKGGWYEEDCEWAIVAHSFPQFFTAYERKMADDSLMRWRPHEYMTVTGKVVDPSESFILREEIHAREHANDWMVISATSLNEGAVLVTATIGGKRDADDVKMFVVPAQEYRAGNLPGRPFVVDPARHEEYASPAGPRP